MCAVAGRRGFALMSMTEPDEDLRMRGGLRRTACADLPRGGAGQLDDLSFALTKYAFTEQRCGGVIQMDNRLRRITQRCKGAID